MSICSFFKTLAALRIQREKRRTDVEEVDRNQHNQIDECKEYEYPESYSVDKVGDNLIDHPTSNGEGNCW